MWILGLILSWFFFFLGWFWVGFGMGFSMGFELILSCFVLILSYFWFDFVDFVFGLSNVEMGCGGRPMIVGWCYVCIWLILSWPVLVCNRGARIWGRREKGKVRVLSKSEGNLVIEPITERIDSSTRMSFCKMLLRASFCECAFSSRTQNATFSKKLLFIPNQTGFLYL